MILGVHSKQPSETYLIYVDFVRRLQVGETISTQSITSKILPAGTDTTATMLQSPGISGTKLEVRLKAAGSDGEDHRVQFRATTNLGSVLEDEVDLHIRED